MLFKCEAGVAGRHGKKKKLSAALAESNLRATGCDQETDAPLADSGLLARTFNSTLESF